MANPNPTPRKPSKHPLIYPLNFVTTRGQRRKLERILAALPDTANRSLVCREALARGLASMAEDIAAGRDPLWRNSVKKDS